MNAGNKVIFKSYASDVTALVESKQLVPFQPGDECELVEISKPAANGDPNEWKVRRLSDGIEQGLYEDEFDLAPEGAVSQPELDLGQPEMAPEIEVDTTDLPEETAPLETEEVSSDDLTQLDGVGAKMAEKLVKYGVNTFAKMAALSDDEAATLNKDLKTMDAIIRKDWRGQAQAMLETAEQAEDLFGETQNVPAQTETATPAPNQELVTAGAFVPATGLILHVDKLIAEQGALEAAQSVRRQADANDYIMGGIVRHIYDNKLYTQLGYEDGADDTKGFEKYVEERLGLRYRKAMYLKDIHEHFTPQGEDFVARGVAIGWSKMKEIAQLMKRDDFDADKAHLLLEYAENHSKRELQAHIKEEYVDAEEGERQQTKKTTFSFPVFADEAEFIRGTLDACKETHGLDDDTEAFKMVFQEYGVINDKGSYTQEMAIAALESRFGVKVTVK